MMNALFEPTDDDELLDQADTFSTVHDSADAHTPFGGSLRQRRILMCIVVFGGIGAVMAMRMLSGGTAQAHADVDLDGAIDGFIAEDSRANRATLADASHLARLLETSLQDWQVPYTEVRANPFIGPGQPGGVTHVADSMGAGAATHMLQRRLDGLEVTMVMRGHVTAAMVDGMRLPLNEAVQTEDGLQLMLLSVSRHAVEIELTEPGSETRLRARVPIGRRNEPS
jgi:hypothetical protein